MTSLEATGACVKHSSCVRSDTGKKRQRQLASSVVEEAASRSEAPLSQPQETENEPLKFVISSNGLGKRSTSTTSLQRLGKP
ncbi:hypothetical protein VTH82DRAFT_6123 [Thermothelomyces myriococcoides]